MTIPLLHTHTNSSEELHLRHLRQKLLLRLAIIVGLVAAVGGFLYGYDTGLINDIMEMQYVKTHIPLHEGDFNTHERALITAVLSLGTFFGALIAPFISDKYGRKLSIIVSSAIIFNVGNVLQVSATDVGLLCAGRGISGLAVGTLSAIVPLYQAEASPKWVRGSVVFTYQWAITWGLLLALAICQGTRKMSSSASYRIPIGIQFLWSTTLCIGMLFLPESPRFLEEVDFMYMNCENSRASTKFVSRAIDYSNMPTGNAGTGTTFGSISSNTDINRLVEANKASSSPSTGENLGMNEIRHRNIPKSEVPNTAITNNFHHLSPTVSDTSSEALASANSTMSTPGITDYQKYLMSLKEHDDNRMARTDSSHTSASTRRKLKFGSKMTTPEKKLLSSASRKHSLATATGTSNHSSSYVSASALQDGIGKKSGLVNAALFFASPPSDSDSDDLDDEEENNQEERREKSNE